MRHDSVTQADLISYITRHPHTSLSIIDILRYFSTPLLDHWISLVHICHFSKYPRQSGKSAQCFGSRKLIAVFHTVFIFVFFFVIQMSMSCQMYSCCLELLKEKMPFLGEAMFRTKTLRPLENTFRNSEISQTLLLLSKRSVPFRTRRFF